MVDHSRALLCELRAVSVAKKPLAFAAALTVAFTAAEFVGGIISGSLALIADAGHMLMDSAALVTACAAVALSARPPSAKRTYGLARLEVLSAFFSAMLLMGVSALIAREALLRLASPPHVDVELMLPIATLGLLINGASALALARPAGKSLGVRGALFHVLSDALSSAVVVAGGLAMVVTGARVIDPALGLALSLFIAASAIKLALDSSHILVEGVPCGLSLDDVVATITSVKGVLGVHDIHVWSLGHGVNLLTCHIEVEDKLLSELDSVVSGVREALETKHDIRHATLQLCAARQNT